MGQSKIKQREGFPPIKSILDGAGKRELKHGVKLTSQGWEAKGLDSAF